MEFDTDAAVEWLRDKYFTGKIYIYPSDEIKYDKLMKSLLNKFDLYMSKTIGENKNFTLDKIDFNYGDFSDREKNSITFHSEEPEAKLEKSYKLNKSDFESIVHNLLVQEVKFYDLNNNHINFLRFSYVNNFIPYTNKLWNFSKNIQYEYLNGRCNELAYELHSKYKLPIYKISIKDLKSETFETDGFHWFVKYKNKYIDAIGLWTEEQLKKSWEHFIAGPAYTSYELLISPIEFNSDKPTVDNEAFDDYFNGKEKIDDETKEIAYKIMSNLYI